jgi:putative flavoprotein involved in K+ transport
MPRSEATNRRIGRELLAQDLQPARRFGSTPLDVGVSNRGGFHETTAAQGVLYVRPVAVDVVIVGGGQAGLGTAFYLAGAGIDFVVLERGRVGETWRTQRWDSFTLNTPNWMNGLPGAPYEGTDPLGFMTHGELTTSFEAYVERFDLPVQTGVTVTRVQKADSDGRFLVVGESATGDPVLFDAGAVVIASGILQSPRIPPVSAKIPDGILQLHTGDYRSPDGLPAGSVVVVGGGQSGAQIVEDLLEANRTVYFSISKVARLPRSYRGRDFMDWWLDMGMWDTRPDDVEDPAELRTRNPTVSGVGARGHSVSFQQLSRDGARLMGRLDDIRGRTLTTDDRVMEHIANADTKSQELKDRIDAWIDDEGLDAPQPDSDPADAPVPAGESIPWLTELDLDSADVGTVIWSTGFGADFSWIELPVTDGQGVPQHDNGVSTIDGIYFIGFPWLSKRKSAVIFGIDEDAQHITQVIVQRASAVRLVTTT